MPTVLQFDPSKRKPPRLQSTPVLHSIEMEECVIAACMLEGKPGFSKAKQAGATIDSFYLGTHRKVWSVFEELDADPQAVTLDLVTVIERVRRNDLLGQITTAWLTEILTFLPVGYSIPHYVVTLNKLQLLRLMSFAGLEVDAKSRLGQLDVTFEQLVAHYHEKFTEFKNSAAALSGQTTVDAKTVVKSVFADITAPPIEYPSTSFPSLDDKIGGFRPGEMSVFAARPGIGKTALALQVAAHNAAFGKRILFFSLEMPAKALMVRVLASKANVPVSFLLRNPQAIYPAGWSRLTDASTEVSTWPLLTIDTMGLDAESIASSTRATHDKSPIDLVIVDYLQFVAPSKSTVKATPLDQLAHTTRKLRELSLETQLPILCLAQLNRSIEQRPGKTKWPVLSDIRGCGTIEQDAVNVIFVHRESPDNLEDLTLIVAKARHGTPGSVPLKFEGGFMRFSERQEVSS